MATKKNKRSPRSDEFGICNTANIQNQEVLIRTSINSSEDQPDLQQCCDLYRELQVTLIMMTNQELVQIVLSCRSYSCWLSNTIVNQLCFQYETSGISLKNGKQVLSSVCYLTCYSKLSMGLLALCSMKQKEQSLKFSLENDLENAFLYFGASSLSVGQTPLGNWPPGLSASFQSYIPQNPTSLAGRHFVKLGNLILN